MVEAAILTRRAGGGRLSLRASVLRQDGAATAADTFRDLAHGRDGSDVRDDVRACVNDNAAAEPWRPAGTIRTSGPAIGHHGGGRAPLRAESRQRNGNDAEPREI